MSDLPSNVLNIQAIAEFETVRYEDREALKRGVLYNLKDILKV